VAIKSALVVDDSKSARFVLQRMLEELNLEVDTVESAVDALDYLTHSHVDVIFMDHMMPGMDGFEAVKRIKENPETSIIPIMMYTSKCGDLYLSQARALGAIGVIAKTIAPVDLKDSLLKLGLIDEASFMPAPEKNKPVIEKNGEKPVSETGVENDDVLEYYIEDLHRLMDDQTVELHKSMWLGVESVSHDIFNKLNSELENKLDEINLISAEVSRQNTHNSKIKFMRPIYIISFFLFISIAFNITLNYKNNRLESSIKAIAMEPSSLNIEQETKNVVLLNHQESMWDFTKWALSKTIEYPYDELALGDDRIPEIEELIRKALEVKFKGRIILQTHAGEFCLSSDQVGGYKLADKNLSVTECEYIGNYTQPGDAPSTHQSLNFANYLSETSSINDRDIYIDITSIPRNIEVSKYPEKTQETSVGTWNHAAQLNNRITVKLEPEPAALQ